MRVAVLLGLVLGALGWAHGEVHNSVPAANSVLKTAPKTVTIQFSEPIEVRLSNFKVYALEAPGNSNKTQLQILARAKVQQVLALKNDADARTDTGLQTTERTSKTVVLALKPELKPGAYVVMWRNLSTDGHTSSSFFVFTFQP